jgi:hypothetical protein
MLKEVRIQTHNLVFQSNSLDFSWKREEEAEMPMAGWRQGEGARGTEGRGSILSLSTA